MPQFGTHISHPIKYKAQKENSNGKEWFSNLQIGNDPDFAIYNKDFNLTTHYSTSDYTLTLVGTGTEAVSTTLVNGILVSTTTNSSSDSNNLQNKIPCWTLDATSTSNDATSAGKRIWWETSISATRVADVDLFIGLSELNTTLLASANYVGFRISNGSAAIACVNAKASAASTIASGVSAVASTSIRLGFLFDGGNAIKFYINRGWVATQTANLPTVVMAESLHIKTNSSNAAVVNQDYVFIAKER